MLPVHKQQKESIHLDAPICLNAPCMFDAPYVWIPLMFRWLPVFLDAPICLPVCLDTPIHLGAPYVRMPPVCLDAAHMFG